MSTRALFWHFPAYLEGGHKESRDTISRTRPVSVVLKEGWKLIENYEDHLPELYNLKDEHSEKVDVKKHYPQKATELYDCLLRWKEEAKAPMPRKSNPWYVAP